MPARRCASLCVVLSWILMGMMTARAAASPPLPCAVEGLGAGVRAAPLCHALAERLGREASLVNDARDTKRGDAIQIIHGDVAWTVVWLNDGRVRTWTRVSEIEPLEQQVKLLAAAARELAKQAKELERAPSRCLRLDPNGGHKVRSSDLAYPWAELSPCKRKLVEVLDPWWLPARAPAQRMPAP